jgi:hypothetical protein
MSMKSIVRASLAGLALLGVASPGGGRAVAAPPATPPPAASPSEPAPPAPTAAPGKDPLLEFVPKEHVPADSAVSFPVDI